AKCAYLVSVDDDDAEELVRPEHRDREHRSDVLDPGHPEGVLGIALGVEDVDEPAVERGPRGAADASGDDGILLDEHQALGRNVLRGDEPQAFPVAAEDEGALRLT